MVNNAIFSPVQEGILEVEARLRSQADGFQTDLKSALDLLLSAGGKRMRPAVTLLMGKMLGANHTRLVTLASAIEMLHTATLVHDDLIDNSLLRRGTPTLNSKWSPGATVLTGDFLFARAAKLAAETDSIEVMKIFSETLSVIVNGEITQLFFGRYRFDRNDYEARIYAKTASLFETATKASALISPVGEEIIQSAQTYGYEIGMAFQIVDDILDFTADPDVLGKPVGSDLRQGLVTLPGIFFAEMYHEDDDVKAILNGAAQNTDAHLLRLIDKIRDSDAIQLSFDEANKCVERSIAALSPIEDSPEKQALQDIARYITARNL